MGGVPAWFEMTRPSKKHGLVVCVRNDEYPVDLEVRKIYRTVPDRAAESHGLVRVIDESGETSTRPSTLRRLSSRRRSRAR